MFLKTRAVAQCEGFFYKRRIDRFKWRGKERGKE
jgi:hypothetical protein